MVPYMAKTKEEVIRKVLKMLELARRSPESEEAKVARATADKLMKQHGISSEDLSTPAVNDAFDELCIELEKFIASNSDTPVSVLEAVRLLKQKISPAEKKSVLKLLRSALQLSSFFGGTAKKYSDLVEGIASRHGL